MWNTWVFEDSKDKERKMQVDAVVAPKKMLWVCFMAIDAQENVEVTACDACHKE